MGDVINFIPFMELINFLFFFERNWVFRFFFIYVHPSIKLNILISFINFITFFSIIFPFIIFLFLLKPTFHVLLAFFPLSL